MSSNLGRISGSSGGLSVHPRDPAKLATALIRLFGPDEPPLRWAAGADAVGVLEDKAQTLLRQADAHRELSSTLAHDA
jgi:hypothetical protein